MPKFTDAELLTDGNGNPIPQIYNPVTGKFEAWQGQNGAATTSLSGSNVELLPNTNLAWADYPGTVLTFDIPVPESLTQAVLLKVSNGCSKDLIVTFQFEYATDTWGEWYDGQGNEVSFQSISETKRIYGPFSSFPAFMSGRVIVTSPESLSSGSVSIAIQGVM